jgi:nitroreductase
MAAANCYIIAVCISGYSRSSAGVFSSPAVCPPLKKINGFYLPFGIGKRKVFMDFAGNEVMDFDRVLTERHSCRSFSKKALLKDAVEAIVRAAESAPSAGNLKARKIIAVTSEEEKGKVAGCYGGGSSFLSEAGAVLVFCADPAKNSGTYGERGISLYAVQDATIACAFAHLKATDLGLGSCWVGAFDEELLKEVLGLSKGVRPVALLPVGYRKKG